MTDTLRVILEIGAKRKVVAGALDWPGLDRGATSEEDALGKLSAYLPRYAGVAERAGMEVAFAQAHDVVVVERVPGTSSTDFWGIAHVPSQIEGEVLAPADHGAAARPPAGLLGLLRRRRGAGVSASSGPRLEAAGGVATRSSATCTAPSPRTSRARSGVRTELDVILTPDGLASHRQAFLDAIRAYNAEGRPARTWPIQFLVRRTAQHVMDHAWELEDRDLGGLLAS